MENARKYGGGRIDTGPVAELIRTMEQEYGEQFLKEDKKAHWRDIEERISMELTFSMKKSTIYKVKRLMNADEL